MDSYPPNIRVKSGLQTKAPAIPQDPGARHKEVITPYAPETLLTQEALAFAALVRQARRSLVKDKAYRSTPIGGEVGRFLRALKWENAAENTLLSYETTLSMLAYDFANRELADLTLEHLRDFLDEHWGDAKASTRRQRLAALKSFYAFCVKERGVEKNLLEKIKPPKKNEVERNAYSVDVIEQLREAQPTLRDQIVIQLYGRLGLRKSEVRLIEIGHFNMEHGHVQVTPKGGGRVNVPIGFPTLKADLEVYVIGRDPKEFLLYPKSDTMRPMTAPGVHLWFKAALRRAGLSESIKLHEMRHSAADNLWRETGNIVLAQKLLRHKSPATTIAYLHPTTEDLEDALRAMDGGDASPRN